MLGFSASSLTSPTNICLQIFSYTSLLPSPSLPMSRWSPDLSRFTSQFYLFLPFLQPEMSPPLFPMTHLNCSHSQPNMRFPGPHASSNLLLQCPDWKLKCKLLSRVWLCNPMDCSPSGSSVQGDSPGRNTGVGCRALLQGIFPNPGTEPRSSALQADSLPSEAPGKPWCSDYVIPFPKMLFLWWLIKGSNTIT